jgi:hypothetical protein
MKDIEPNITRLSVNSRILSGARMKEVIRKLDAEYAIGLTEEEIDLIARQAEDSAKLYQKLYEVDVPEEGSVSNANRGEKQ